MDMNFTEEQNMLRDTVRKLMDKHAPVEKIRQWDKERVYPYALYDAWLEAGLLRMPFPEAYGGLGGNVIDMAIINEEIAYRSADLSMCYGGNIFCGLNIAHKATEEQKRYWLPQLLEGKIRFSISMSEPDAGSDIGAMRTTARRDGDHYVLNGMKRYITNAPLSDVFTVIARTEEGTQGHAGLTAFLVERGPGLSTGEPYRKMGQAGSPVSDVYFDQCKVPSSHVIGLQEGVGFKTVMKVLNKQRLHLAALCTGPAMRMLELAIHHTQQRVQFGQPVAQHQLVQAMIADCRTEIFAARSMILEAARARDRGEDVHRAFHRDVEQQVCLNHFETFVHQGRRVHGHHRAHCPGGMLQGLLCSDLGKILARVPAKRSTAGRQNQARYFLMCAAAQCLRKGAVL